MRVCLRYARVSPSVASSYARVDARVSSHATK